MKLLDVLKLIERDYFPPTIDDKGEIGSRPQSQSCDFKGVRTATMWVKVIKPK